MDLCHGRQYIDGRQDRVILLSTDKGPIKLTDLFEVTITPQVI